MSNDQSFEVEDLRKASRIGCFLTCLLVPLLAVLLGLVKMLTEDEGDHITIASQNLNIAWLVSSLMAGPFAILLIVVSIVTRLSVAHKTGGIIIGVLALVNTFYSLKIILRVILPFVS